MTDKVISKKGVLEIAEHEGIVLGPYRDSRGFWTWGVGHTRFAGGPDPRTMPRVDTRPWSERKVTEEIIKALRLFDVDLDKFEARVREAITVPLRQHQFDALVSFDFNTGGIYRAKLTAAINRRDPDAAEHFMGWIKPKEIIKRREAEMKLFMTGNYDANGRSIVIWDALGDGRLARRKVIDSAELGDLSRRAVITHQPHVLPQMRVWRFLQRLIGEGG